MRESEETKQQRDPYIYQRIKIRTQQGTYEQEDEEDIEIVRYKEKKEQMPKRIKYMGRIFEYNENETNYITVEKPHDVITLFVTWSWELNEEVEIIEENKIPEKLSTWFSVETKQSKELNIEYANTNFENMYEKINEICDYLKSKGDE